ncbi:esterase, partial [Kineococcus sp. TRM81007]|uniref:LGFP repeat-containing protein n=1 Tax=Kineococcus sp. TRM81007 TaxID=2925831 RepID=UPI0035A8F993|nr:esterase [Kineococcus sp. TRM81007]
TRTPDGRGAYNHFQNGSIYWSSTTGAHAVRGAVRDAWAARGWEAGALGFPTGAQRTAGDAVEQDFQGGTLVVRADGSSTVRR